jgi:hypothetical protein
VCSGLFLAFFGFSPLEFSMWSADQQRFLGTYQEHREVAAAARAADIHRSSVYRWRKDPAFVKAMDAAWQGYQQWRREVYEPWEKARQAEKERRRPELLPIWRAHQAKAMEAKRRNRGY